MRWMLRNGPFQPLMMGRAKKVWSWSEEEGRASLLGHQTISKQNHFHFLNQTKTLSLSFKQSVFNTCIGNSYSKQGQGKKSNSSNDWTIAVENICKDEYGPRAMAPADN